MRVKHTCIFTCDTFYTIDVLLVTFLSLMLYLCHFIDALLVKIFYSCIHVMSYGIYYIPFAQKSQYIT